MRLSPKARAIMNVIMEGYKDEQTGEQKWWGIREVVPRLPYKTTRDSLYFSIRALERKGYVEKGTPEKRNGFWVVPLLPSHKAIDELGKKPGRPVIYYDEISEIVEYLD